MQPRALHGSPPRRTPDPRSKSAVLNSSSVVLNLTYHYKMGICLLRYMNSKILLCDVVDVEVASESGPGSAVGAVRKERVMVEAMATELVRHVGVVMTAMGMRAKL